MTVHVEHVAMLNVRGLPRDGAMHLPDGATVEDLLAALDVPQTHRNVIAPFVNERRALRDARLHDGDRIFLALPVGGG